MPRVKKKSSSISEKKLEKKPKKTVKVITKKPTSEIKKPKSLIKKRPAKEKVLSEKKKALPVIIDVIEDEDEDEEKNESFFPELPESNKDEDILSLIGKKNDSEESSSGIDQQKKFFSELITEIKDKNPNLKSKEGDYDDSEQEKKRSSKSVNLYRRLVWRFIALTAVLLLIVFYFSFSKLTIIVSPKGETINDNILLKVSSANNIASSSNVDPGTDFRESISGTVNEVAVSGEKIFQASGEEFIGEEIAGKVKIINNSAKAQALVAKTRILSPDNKLFRIKEAVNVPAGGEEEVDIYADKPSEDLAISATSFTIPGLWLGLQDKIYAKSSDDFVYRQKVKKYIKASDIEQATNEMNNILLDQAKQNQEKISKDQEMLYETLNPANLDINAKAGDAKDSFTVKASGSLVAVIFSKTDVAKLTSAKLNLLVPDDKNLVDYNPENITYTFDNYDPKTGTATIRANFSGTMVLKSDTEIIDKKQLVNLNRQQLENYLKTFPEIKSYELKFFPSFISHAPRLPEGISIEIKGLEK